MQSHVVKIMEIGKLAGNTAKFAFLGPLTWSLKFENGSELSNFSLCRIIKENQLVASTRDHGEWFGLNEQYNAEEELNSLVENSIIIEVYYGSSVNDLIFSMSNGITIEILSVSTGYESWEYSTQEGGYYVATGSGNINEF